MVVVVDQDILLRMANQRNVLDIAVLNGVIVVTRTSIAIFGTGIVTTDVVRETLVLLAREIDRRIANHLNHCWKFEGAGGDLVDVRMWLDIEFWNILGYFL